MLIQVTLKLKTWVVGNQFPIFQMTEKGQMMSNDLVNQMTQWFYMYLYNSCIIKQKSGNSPQRVRFSN